MTIFFKILDYLSALAMGIGTLFLVTLVVGRGWNMFLAMVAGMVIGMGVLLLALILFCSFSTLFELVPKGMIITMVTGMVSGMAAANGQGFTLMASASAVFSFGTQIAIDLYNMKVSGEVTIDKDRQ